MKNKIEQDIQVVWEQHKIDPLPILYASEIVAGVNLLQLIGQVDKIIEKFVETKQLAQVSLTMLTRYQGQVEIVMEATQNEKQDYFARLYLLCHLIIQFYRRR